MERFPRSSRFQRMPVQLVHRQFRDVARKNIAYFLNQKKEKKRWKPFVSLHILKMRETVSEIGDFLKKWSPLLGKGDNILLKDVHTFGGR